MAGVETPATNHNSKAQPMNRTTSQANQATKSAILAILADGRQLRQFEIAAKLGLTEHHDWSTHATIEAMLRDGLIAFERYHNVTKKGGLSKLTYRHFSLTYKGSQTARTRSHGMRRRDILRDWARMLGF
jgi:hypothetical protein